MTVIELLALLPILFLAGTVLVLQLLLCIKRDLNWSISVYCGGLLLTLLSLFELNTILADSGPITVTSLIIIDHYFIFFAQLFLATSLLIGLMARSFLIQTVLRSSADEFYIFLTLVLLGAFVLAASQHFVAFFLGLELMNLALFPLLAYSLPTRSSSIKSTSKDQAFLGLEASMKYLLLSALSTAILLFGIACLYFQQGTLSFTQGLLTAPNFIMILGFSLVLIAAAFKLSLVPFHLWTPDVYEGSPTSVTALVATVSKGAVLVVLLRYIAMAQPSYVEAIWQVLTIIAILSMLFGNLLALLQQNIKRVLAYSSIAHMGYLVVALMVLASVEIGTQSYGVAVEAIGFYLVAYFVTTVGAFAVVSQVSDAREGSYHLDFYRGLFWRSPKLASALIVMLLSLAGIPLTIGFIGKFYLFLAGVQGELWWLLSAVVIGSALGLYYYLRIIIVLMQQPLTHDTPEIGDKSTLDGMVLALLVVFLLFIGIYPAPLIALIPITL